MKLSNVIRCPKCSMPLFVEADNGYMIHNIIIDRCEGSCGCGQDFVIVKNHEIFWIDMEVEYEE